MPDSSHLTRRRMLHMSASALLAAGVWPGLSHAADAPATGDFSFICVNDLHLFDRGCVPFFEKMIARMKAIDPKPIFAMVIGDLGENGTSAQLGLMNDVLKTLELPFYVVCGNHDFQTQTDRRPFQQLFPAATNYAFDYKGWQFVGLDTTEGQKSDRTKVSAETLDWLATDLPKLDNKKPTILVTHFPMGLLVPGRPTNADAVLNPFKDFNLQAVFNGHFHAQTVRQRWHATMTTSQCCSFRRKNHDGSPEKGFFLCSTKDGKVTRSFVEVKAD